MLNPPPGGAIWSRSRRRSGVATTSGTSWLRPRRRGLCYFIAASFSASSSHDSMRRITAARAGIPFGNSCCRSASRSKSSFGAARVSIVDRRRPFDAAACRLPFAWALLLDAPATPCARRRWAPSDAGREKVLPHSGHVNSPVPSWVAGCLRDLATVTYSISLSTR